MDFSYKLNTSRCREVQTTASEEDRHRRRGRWAALLWLPVSRALVQRGHAPWREIARCFSPCFSPTIRPTLRTVGDGTCNWPCHLVGSVCTCFYRKAPASVGKSTAPLFIVLNTAAHPPISLVPPACASPLPCHLPASWPHSISRPGCSAQNCENSIAANLERWRDDMRCSSTSR